MKINLIFTKASYVHTSLANFVIGLASQIAVRNNCMFYQRSDSVNIHRPILAKDIEDIENT